MLEFIVNIDEQNDIDFRYQPNTSLNRFDCLRSDVKTRVVGAVRKRLQRSLRYNINIY